MTYPDTSDKVYITVDDVPEKGFSDVLKEKAYNWYKKNIISFSRWNKYEMIPGQLNNSNMSGGFLREQYDTDIK